MNIGEPKREVWIDDPEAVPAAEPLRIEPAVPVPEPAGAPA